MSDLPESAADPRPTENKSQWYLDVDFDANPTVPGTPSYIHTDKVSTSALPLGIEESTRTATPCRFEPKTNADDCSVSNRTYNHIRE